MLDTTSDRRVDIERNLGKRPSMFRALRRRGDRSYLRSGSTLNALAVLFAGALVVGPVGHWTQPPPPAHSESSAGTAGLLAAAAGNGNASAGNGEPAGGEPGGDATNNSTTGPTGTAQPRGTKTGSTYEAALSHVAAGLVDIETVTDRAELLGTGMVLRSDGGLVLTNHHVIDHAVQIRVRDVGDRHVYRASVVAADTTHDLALLRLQGATNLTVVAFGDSRGVNVGDPITALGNAGGGNGNPIAATGTVTALDQAVDAQGDDGATEHLTGMIQANANAAPGDSGGPVLDRAGAIIGVTTAGSDNDPGARQATDSTGQTGGRAQPAIVDATPINVARAWIAQFTASTEGTPGSGIPS